MTHVGFTGNLKRQAHGCTTGVQTMLAFSTIILVIVIAAALWDVTRQF